MIERLPDDCSVEDIQYHPYVLEKVRRGLDRADTEGVIEQDEAEERLRSGSWRVVERVPWDPERRLFRLSVSGRVN